MPMTTPLVHKSQLQVVNVVIYLYIQNYIVPFPTKNLYLFIFIGVHVVRSSMFVLNNHIVQNDTYAYSHTYVL